MTSVEARTFGIQIYDHWTALWNLNLLLAPLILGSRLVLRYAQPGTEPMDNTDTPEKLTALIEAWHAKRQGIQFFAVGEACIDLQNHSTGFSGLVSRPYEVGFRVPDAGSVRFGGTDTLRISHSRITEVWSVSAGPHGRCFYRGQDAA